ncbi:DUF3422 domain-containing protein [Halocynthiibacter sp. C4]|uniref:DUF3422 family protein n=1 Tax=Halocynthiibacter sp. C4 TaxID=2992758 RepID=UPI00237AC36F|nr:DUF3422 domain-containing protein [Halocynthiibacter sp. C4]MDE0589232.1 DUF3422 domain-containing protein [Halocynthiibacter sp. C4]
MDEIKDHPDRYHLANELHARPFPALSAPASAVFLALKTPDGQERDYAAERAHLLDLLDRHGAVHPRPGATHYFGPLGRHFLKWESHSEFLTYTIFTEAASSRAFDPKGFEVFPKDWCAKAPGLRLTSAHFHIEKRPEHDEAILENLIQWFVPESLAVSEILDASALVASDFRIDEAGHVRFAMMMQDGVGPQRTGRILQRLCEIETYKTMAMLGYLTAKNLMGEIGPIESELTGVVARMGTTVDAAEETLAELKPLTARLEQLTAETSYRFGATNAYEAIVNQRIKILREERYRGRQTFDEFMMRRFDPAMRTVTAAEKLLQRMSDRAVRAAELLRTRVDVERGRQNQEILRSMDRRADLQLRLQQTVEGLSVVAISYYAVSLLGYFFAPMAKNFHLSKTVLTAGLVPFVVFGVWMYLKNLKKRIGH